MHVGLTLSTNLTFQIAYHVCVIFEILLGSVNGGACTTFIICHMLLWWTRSLKPQKKITKNLEIKNEYKNLEALKYY